MEVKDAWRAHTEHEFVNRLADGTLPIERFKYYLIQDYLYLVSVPCSVTIAISRRERLTGTTGTICPSECLGSIQSQQN